MRFDPCHHCHEGRPNGGDAGGLAGPSARGWSTAPVWRICLGRGPLRSSSGLPYRPGGLGGCPRRTWHLPISPQGRPWAWAGATRTSGMRCWGQWPPLRACAGHQAAVMGDINCDLTGREGTAGAEAWGLALNASGYVAMDTIGQWAGMATRVPQGDQTGSPMHLDIIAVSGPGVVRFDPKMVSVGTDTELDTPGCGGCPRAKGTDCPLQCSCACIDHWHQYSDHKLMVWG